MTPVQRVLTAANERHVKYAACFVELIDDYYHATTISCMV